MCVFKISRVKKYTNLVIILLFKYRFYYRATFVVIKFSWSPKTSLVHTLRKPQASRASLAPNWKANSTLNFNAEIYALLRATCLFSFKSMLFCTVSKPHWWRTELAPPKINLRACHTFSKPFSWLKDKCGELENKLIKSF